MITDSRVNPVIHAPAFLIKLQAFLLWRYVQKPGEPKPRKVPYYANGNVRSGKQGDNKDREQLAFYDEGHAVYRNNGAFAGIGVAMLKEWGITALDFDKCIVNGRIDPRVQDLIKDTYSEISPSGTGIRAFMRGALPSRKSPAKDGQFGFETFSDSGFVTLTGDMTDGCVLLGMDDTLQDLTPDVHAMYIERFGEGSDTAPAKMSSDPLMTYVPKAGIEIAQLKDLLAKLDPGCTYMNDNPNGLSWVKVGMALHHETDGGREGLDLFDEWSKGSKDKYPGRGQIEAKWRSFNVNSGSTVTARWIVRQVMIIQGKEEGKPLLDHKDVLGMAREFLDRKFLNHDGVTLVRLSDTWYRHTGQCYEECIDSTVRAMVWHFLHKSLKVSLKGDIVPMNPTKGLVDSVVDALKAVANLDGIEPPAWRKGYSGPPPSELVSLKNGLFHIPSRQLMPHNAGLLILNALPYEWDERAECGEWLRFLEQLFPNDREAQDTLQEMFGYLVTPDTSLQKMFLILGPRRSGKGTIGRVLRAMLGSENVVGPTLSSMTSQFGLQPMIGKLLALLPDARVGYQANAQAMVERLLMVSGEDNVSIDRKHQSSWTGTLGARFVFLTNELPQLGDASGALSGRFIILTLIESFYGREDPGLTPRLLQELPGIFTWAIGGRDRLYHRGHFVQPKSGQEDSDDMAELSSPVTAFVAECCDIGPGYSVLKDELFMHWREWCRVCGRTGSGTKSTFGKSLKAAFPRLNNHQVAVDGTRARAFSGIRLKGVQDNLL